MNWLRLKVPACLLASACWTPSLICLHMWPIAVRSASKLKSAAWSLQYLRAFLTHTLTGPCYWPKWYIWWVMPSVCIGFATFSSVQTILLCLQTSRLSHIVNNCSSRIGQAHALLFAGEYLKTKRSLIRANEKLAGLSEKVDGLKLALSRAGVHNNSDSPSARSDTSTQPFGTPKSVQAGTPRTEAMASVKFWPWPYTNILPQGRTDCMSAGRCVETQIVCRSNMLELQFVVAWTFSCWQCCQRFTVVSACVATACE